MIQLHPTKSWLKIPERRLVCAAAVLLSLQPLASHEMWWHIVRGKTVLSGELQSSQRLLVNEQLPNSDFLSGTIPAIAYVYFGVAGLMFLKLIVGLYVGWRLQEQSKISPWKLFCSIILLVAVQPIFDPTPGTVDLLGILVSATLAAQRRYFFVFICAAVWANFSVGALWVIPTFLCFATFGTPSPVRSRLVWLGALCLALSMTPRGIGSVRDMGVLFAPWLFNDAAFLTGTEYATCEVTIPVLAAIFLGLAVVVSPEVSSLKKVFVSGLILCALQTARNMPAAGALSGLLLLDATENSFARIFQATTVRIGFLASAIGIVVLSASGGIGGHGERLGWGVADAIDIRFAERDLQPHQNSELRAYCTDIIGAGTLLLACPTAAVVDVPEAAIRSGRLQQFWLLNHDLSTGRKAAFTRQDGSEGGWWRALMNNNISLLVVSSNRTEILASLEPTLWKPLSLDAPALILAAAGIPRFTPQIVRARAERDLVDAGDWQYQLYSRTPQPSHTDLWALAVGVSDNRVDLRQARVFRAMQMSTGSVRTLLPVLWPGGRPSAAPEFLKAQQLLAWNEWLNCGQVSAFRCQTLVHLCGETLVPGIATRELTVGPGTAIPPETIRLYCSGDTLAAANSLTSTTAESLYAKYRLYLEAGDGRLAEAALISLDINCPDHPLTALIRMLRDVE